MKPTKAKEKSAAESGRISPSRHRSPQGGRHNRDRILAELTERGAIAIELVVRASSEKEVLNLLATINEVEFLIEASRLAIKNLDSEPLGLPGRTEGERRRINLVRRLAWLVDIVKIVRKVNETRLQALWRLLGDKSDSELERTIRELEREQRR